MIYSTFEDTSWLDQMIPSLAEMGVTVETRGENDYVFSYADDGEGVKLRVAWDKVSVSPVDFSDKNVVTFSFDSTELPEVDLIDVAKEAWAKLAADASVQKVAEILGSVDAATVESAVGEISNS